MEVGDKARDSSKIMSGTPQSLAVRIVGSNAWLQSAMSGAQPLVQPDFFSSQPLVRNQTTQPSKQCWYESVAIFHKIDITGDGILDLNELKTGLADCGASENEIEELFFTLDTNADNQVLTV